MIKLIVCGGRDYADKDKVFATLDKVLTKHETVFIIQGGATGADALAAEWAASRGQPCAEVKANFGYFGKGGGPVRNGWMLVLGATGVVAFKGGDGTADMVEKARLSSIPVMEVTP